MALLNVFPAKSGNHVMYNVLPEHVSESKSPESPAWEYVHRVAAPPPITEAEVDEVLNAVSECVDDVWDDADFPRLDAAHEETRPLFGEPGGDRSVPMFMRGLGVVTPRLITQLQETLAQHELWRIVMYEEDPSEEVTVYPDVVLVGSAPREAPLEESLAAWRLRAQERRNTPQYRLLKKRFEQLEPRVPDAIASLPESGMQILAVYDHLSGDASLHSVWVVQRSRPEDRDLQPRDDVRRFMPNDQYPVDLGGDVGGRGEPSPDDLYLVEWRLPARERHEYRIALCGKGGPETIVGEWFGTIEPGEITREREWTNC